MDLFKLRGELTNRAQVVLGVLGVVVVLGVWYFLTRGADPIIPRAILPAPGRVLTAFPDLYYNNDLIRNTFFSIGINLGGYVEAIAIAIPIGFIIGLIPLFRGAFQYQVDAIRYIPITALIGLFIVWFQVTVAMKIHFLAFGILIYLIPVMIQRINEVQDVYLKTVFTLGANGWQTFRTVYVPSVISRLSDDIRVLTAISWTYIIVAENIGSEGGLGSLLWRVGWRQYRIDKIFALLLIIMLFGILQDRFLVWLDKKLFPHKYQIKDQDKTGRLKQQSIFSVLGDYAAGVLFWILGGVYLLLFINEFAGFLGSKPLSYLFGDTVWFVHVIVLLLLALFGYRSVKQLLQPKKS